MDLEKIQRSLLSWYANRGRDLPWRRERDPYRIWVAEVMLQQTQVETVIPYYYRWLEAFPNLTALAAAEEEEVLKIWEGLGYYRRARNLHKTAKMVVANYGGSFPRTMDDLRRLPGIGDYTAAALGSIAFGLKAPALESNGKRVLARLSAFREPINVEKNAKILSQMLETLLPEKDAGSFNQALMDLGASVCSPHKPNCADCPLQRECASFKQGLQTEIPSKTPRKPLPHYEVVAAIICRGEMVLIDKRRSGGLLGGMWEFPGGKVEEGEGLEEAIAREIQEELDLIIKAGKKINAYKHAYTHFSVTVHALECEIVKGRPRALKAEDIAWVCIDQLERYPMGKVDRLISVDLKKRDK